MDDGSPVVPTQGRAERPRKAVWILALALGVAAAGGVGYWWQTRQHEAGLVASLPAMPALSGRPVELKSRLEKALAQARTAGRFVEGAMELGRLCHANGLRAEAEACWRLLRAEQPTEARWSYYLADLRKVASDYAEMDTLLDETVRLAPTYAPAWLQLAEHAFKRGDYQQAQVHYRKRLELVPGDPYARLGLARVELQAGRRSAARIGLEALARDVPLFPSSHSLLAEMLAADGDEAGAQRERQLARKAGRFREAEDAWMDELNAWCLDPRRLYVLGTMEYQTGRHEKAVEYLLRAVSLVPGDPVASEMLGDLYLKLGKAKEAEDALRRCVELSKVTALHPLIFVMLSQAHRFQQESAEAIEVAEKGLRTWPHAPELLNAKGAALADQGRHAEAIVVFEEALAIYGSNAEAAYNLGASHAALGHGGEAVAALRRALALQPRMAQALALLGRIELDTGQLQAAREHLKALFEAYPEAPQAVQLFAYWHVVAGRGAEKRKDLAGAERIYREGLAVLPAEAELNASLGALLLMQTRFADAVSPLETHRRLRPEDPQAALFLGQAYAAVGRVEEARKILAEGAQLADRAGKRETAAFCREILGQL